MRAQTMVTFFISNYYRSVSCTIFFSIKPTAFPSTNKKKQKHILTTSESKAPSVTFEIKVKFSPTNSFVTFTLN